MHYKMKNKKTQIFTLTGIILIIVDFKTTPYQNLKFPLDVINIEIIVLGLSIMTSILIKIIDNKIFENIVVVILPILVVRKYGVGILFATKAGVSDLFLSIFRLTYPIAIFALIVQVVSFKMNARILTIISFIIGLFWTLISVIEMISFLDYRQGAVEYAEEPKNIWSFVLIMYMITLWTILKLNNLKRLKTNNAWCMRYKKLPGQ